MSFFTRFNQSIAQNNEIDFNFRDIMKKIVCFLLILICIGLPVINIFSFLVIFLSGLAIVSGKINCSFKKLIIIFFMVASVILIKNILPRAALQEGHSIFLLSKGKGAIEEGLPPEVFRLLKQQFLQRYSKYNQSGNAPKSLFSLSMDSVYSKPKYSRIVDSIDFNNLAEFRGSFTNSLDYNWFGDSIIKRENMPFFVMYELSPAVVNSSLCWTGYTLWEDKSEHFQILYNQVQSCRKITTADIGKKIFVSAINNKEQVGFWGRIAALRSKLRSFFSAKNSNDAQLNEKEAYSSVHLILSPLLKISSIFKVTLELFLTLFVLGLAIKINWRRFISAAVIIFIAATIAYFYCPELFGQYRIYEGGEDGLTHQTLGRKILTHAVSGDWVSALRGEQDVFWDTPGFRYFRAIEKLIFGDTDLGYLAIALLFPYVFFGFIASFVSKKWAFWTTIFFLLAFLPFHILDSLGFTYYIYVLVVRGGWPDVLAFTTFLGALVLMLRYVDTRSNGYCWYGFWANFLLGITVFMRPQFAVTALIVVLYFVGRLVMAKRFKEAFLSLVGFIPASFPLMHNYFFGHKFYLFTGAIDMAVCMPPQVYFNSLKEFLAGNFSGENGIKVALHLKALVGPWYRLVFLGAVFYAAFLKRKIHANLRLIAIACFSLHFVNLFIFAVYFRYVFLTWALTVVIMLFLIYSQVTVKKIK